MFLLTALVVLARISSAEILASSPLCDKLREGRATPEQANSTIGPWAQRQFDEWRGLNATGFRTTGYNATGYNATSHNATSHRATGDDNRFWTWFHHKWAPDAADSIISCKLSKVCSAVSCQFINDQYSLDDQINAYWSLESITNFHNMAYEIKGANEKAWNSVEGDLPNIIDTFSDGKNIEAEKKRHDKQWKLIGHTITGTTLAVGAACTLLTAGMSAGVIGTADALVIAGTSISKTSIALFGAEVGMLGSTVTTANNFGSDFMGGKDYVGKMDRMLRSSQKINHDKVYDAFDKHMLNIMSGETKGSTSTSTLVKLIESGRYLEPGILTFEHNAAFRQQWTASFISSIWNVERTYIVMSDVNGGRCDSDTRGFQGIRVCLEEAPNYVFYMFAKTHVREGTMHKALIRGPLGHGNLEASTNYTLTDVVRASYVASKHYGYHILHRKDNMVDNFYSVNSFQAGGKAHGMFNIPILYSPGGEAISSINSKKNRNYPCMAAALPWSLNGQKENVTNDDELAGEEEETNTTTEDEFTPENSTRKAVMNSLQPRGEIWDWIKDKANRVKDKVKEVFTTGKNKVKELITGKGAESGGTWTNNDPETMFQFLNVTGLYRSKDWWTYCHKRGEHHGNHCRGNKAVNWEGKFPGGAYKKIRHPFAHCKTRGHEFKGCESPNNNGFQENKNCGSGKSGSGQSGMAEMKTYDSSYGMAFDAANHLDRTEDMDEAELSDWTDGSASDAEDDASMDEFSDEGDFE
ncbi:hypothetical protein AUEXF2481DRAFT_44738 [Aureobasidium subglaciale EXF-2481]|uniref:Uncharacterized protein n=1 Tax=Aureobasidium subglaciale (strain EXF-2481) TaxID=1043005 RepID=A0A074YVB2_AURSE|nr:uncharacterized protein AUEXF2481DRAFT_44738 [Aureobasidium subglaciale EXF-2481]KEQ90836.1 hypothetical protein AUEXF2481DRAFT_44738 [Aureobasidium subglaciale EXF-2481]